jgi:hypothetical protein
LHLNFSKKNNTLTQGVKNIAKLIYTYTQEKSKIIYTTSVGQFMSFMKNLGFQFLKKIRNVLVLVQKKLEPQIWFWFGS